MKEQKKTSVRLKDFIPSETAVLDFVARSLPWIASGIPATFTFRNATQHLELSMVESLLIGVCVEALGIATIHTAFQVRSHNKKLKDVKKRLPSLVSFLMAAFYVVIIITVNVLLDISAEPNMLIVSAKAMLSLITIPAAVTLTIRAEMHESEVKHDSDTIINQLRGRIASATKKNNSLQKTISELQDSNKSLQVDATAVAELERHVATLQQTVSELERNEASLKQQLEQSETDWKQGVPFWNDMNPLAQAVFQYMAGEITSYDAIADVSGGTKTQAHRLHAKLNGAKKES